MNVQLAGGGLMVVSHSCRFAHRDDLFDSPLTVGAFQGTYTEEIREEAHQGVFRLEN